MSHSAEKSKAPGRAHAVTVLASADGRCCRKIVDLNDPANTVEADKAGKWFNVETVGVRDLKAVEALLLRLQGHPDKLVIRGELISGDRSAKGVYRRSNDRVNVTTGEPEPATFHDVPRKWIAIDIDELPVEDGFDRLDRGACLKRALEVLPGEFAGVSCVLQFTGSHMIKPGLRLRLWFLLHKALSCDQAKHWLMRYPAVDLSLYRTVQPHYVAPPAFAAGSTDPVPLRVVMMRGARERVSVPDWVLGAGHGPGRSGGVGRPSGGAGGPLQASDGTTSMPEGSARSWHQIKATAANSAELLDLLIKMLPPDRNRPDLNGLLWFLRERATEFDPLLNLICGTAVHDIGVDIDIEAVVMEIEAALRIGMTRAGRSKQDIERRIPELPDRLRKLVERERARAQAQLDSFDGIEPDAAPERDLDELQRDLHRQLSEGRDV